MFRTLGIVFGLLLMVCLGFMGAVIVHPVIVEYSAAPEHRALIKSMEVIDVKAGYRLKPIPVDAGIREYGALIPLEAIFTKYREYPQSTWIWQREGDTEIAMTIWGPDDSGKILYVEVARLSCNPFEIRVNGETVLVIEELKETVAKQSNPGYYVLEIHIQSENS